MSQVLLLKIENGLPTENATTDDITFSSFSITGGGPSLSSTGLAMAIQDITALKNLTFNDPTVDVINQTAGNLVIDDIMAKERNNVMATTGAILFPLITDTAGQVDSFKLPNVAGAPSATPAFSAVAGYMVYDSTNKNAYVWDGTAWDNLNTVTTAQNLDSIFTTTLGVAARDVVYISGADLVDAAKGNADATSDAFGFALTSAAALGSVSVRQHGIVTGFTGLTAGARYYVSSATAGAITSTPPNGSGHSIMQCGIAKSATAIITQFQFMGKRA